MFRSWRIGSAFGIGLFVHWSFVLLPVWILVSQWVQTDFDHAAFLVAVLLAMFGCIIFHELGHALVARRFGIGQ
jgi:hypothetical protein